MAQVRVPMAAAVAALAFAATACGSSSGGGAAAGPASSPPTGPVSFEVLVDGHTADNKAAFTTFFPKVLQVHPGDTVVFHSAYSGEPHTVAMGTVVTAALDKADALLKADPKALDGEPPAEFKKIPQLLPDGPGDAIQAGAQPCVVAADATLPTADACAVQEESEFAGTEQLASSGWLGVDEDYRVTFSSAIAPGTYRIMCQLHSIGMTAEVQVVPASTTIKDPAAVKAEGLAARDAALADLKPAFDALSTATPDKAIAGGLSATNEGALVTSFGPGEISIPVGGTVRWGVSGPHSIAFNAPADAQSLRQPGADKTVHLSSKAFLPAGGPGADPAAEKPATLINGGSWDGTGFRSSGVIFGGPPPNATVFTLTFSKAGSYAFLCTVHEDMKGTVKVG